MLSMKYNDNENEAVTNACGRGQDTPDTRKKPTKITRGAVLNCSKKQSHSAQLSLCTRLSSSTALVLRNFHRLTVSSPSPSHESEYSAPDLNPPGLILRNSLFAVTSHGASYPYFLLALNQGASSFASCSFSRSLDLVCAGSNSFESRYVLHQEGNLRA